MPHLETTVEPIQPVPPEPSSRFAMCNGCRDTLPADDLTEVGDLLLCETCAVRDGLIDREEAREWVDSISSEAA